MSEHKCWTCGADTVYEGDGYWKCESCNEAFYEGSDDEETLSVYDAALIWASNGKDEDYTFGYTEDELERAL